MSLVGAGERPRIPPRGELPGPDTAAFGGLDAYVALLQKCWAQDPQERPAFAAIAEELRWGCPCMMVHAISLVCTGCVDLWALALLDIWLAPSRGDSRQLMSGGEKLAVRLD